MRKQGRFGILGAVLAAAGCVEYAKELGSDSPIIEHGRVFQLVDQEDERVDTKYLASFDPNKYPDPGKLAVATVIAGKRFLALIEDNGDGNITEGDNIHEITKKDGGLVLTQVKIERSRTSVVPVDKTKAPEAPKLDETVQASSKPISADIPEVEDIFSFQRIESRNSSQTAPVNGDALLNGFRAVRVKDENGNLRGYLAFDSNNDRIVGRDELYAPLFEQKKDEKGKPLTDSNGKPVMELAGIRKVLPPSRKWRLEGEPVEPIYSQSPKQNYDLPAQAQPKSDDLTKKIDEATNVVVARLDGIEKKLAEQKSAPGQAVQPRTEARPSQGNYAPVNAEFDVGSIYALFDISGKCIGLYHSQPILVDGVVDGFDEDMSLIEGLNLGIMERKKVMEAKGYVFQRVVEIK